MKQKLFILITILCSFLHAENEYILQAQKACSCMHTTSRTPETAQRICPCMLATTSKSYEQEIERACSCIHSSSRTIEINTATLLIMQEYAKDVEDAQRACSCIHTTSRTPQTAQKICPCMLATTSKSQDMEKACSCMHTTTSRSIDSSLSQQLQQTPVNVGTTPFLVFNPPYLITQPGQYSMVTDISVPANSNGIVIQADNVLLDLQEKRIAGPGTGSGVGILITGNNRSNITIQNGSITGMGSNAIQIVNGGQNIIFRNLKIAGNGNNGISMGGLRNFIIQDCLITLNRSNGLIINQFGTQLNNDGFFVNLVSTFNGLNGFSFAGCTNCQMLQLLANNNSGNGIVETNGNRIIFNGCQANNNNSNGISTTGLGHLFQQCTTNNNVGVGFFINTNRLNMEDSQAKGNGLDGFRILGSNCRATDCSAMNNRQIGFNINGNQQVYQTCDAEGNNIGFQIAQANNCVLNSAAKANTTFGFLLVPSSNECQIRSNTATGNATGFQNNGTMNRIYSNFSNNNSTANFVGIANVFVSPIPADPINFTTNISN
ncbi:MAG: right-handed parallel beta-helix repeat-containing protein [Candidatus Babeliales bacterium]